MPILLHGRHCVFPAQKKLVRHNFIYITGLKMKAALPSAYERGSYGDAMEIV